jgi:hypothetical protein
MEEPGIIDGEIIEEMKSLELMITFHKKAQIRGIETNLFLPERIKGLVNQISTQGLWDSQEYDAIRYTYASAWMRYYTIKFAREIYYNESHFANFFKTD